MVPLIVGGSILVVIVIAVAFFFARKRTPKNFAGAETYRSLLGVTPAAEAASPSTDPAHQALRQNLRVKYLYQEDKIDAAIQLERERNPAAPVEQLMKSAIERWERDNR